jgi:putative addiction module component (TIGR02574 family)
MFQLSNQELIAFAFIYYTLSYIITLMARELLEEILELSINERIQLVQDIWDSIAQIPASLELDEDQKEELRTRLAHYRAHPETGISWDELKQKIGL